jgi:hypothetical protein
VGTAGGLSGVATSGDQSVGLGGVQSVGVAGDQSMGVAGDQSVGVAGGVERKRSLSSGISSSKASGASGRGLHSSTYQLNVSASCGIGGACRGCLGGVSRCKGALRGVQGVYLFSNGSG